MLTNIKRLAVAVVLGLMLVDGAQAVTVSFLNINDTNPQGFSTAGTAPDPVNGNKLNINVDSFFLEVFNGAVDVMFDTLSFNIEAPEGFFIKSLKYREGLKTSVNGGTTISHGSLSANGQGSTLGFFAQPDPGTSNFYLQTELLLSGQQTFASVAITNSLTAVSFPGGEAKIYKGFNLDNEAEKPFLEVTLQAVPVPAAVWLFGSALVGFIAFSRRRLS